MYKTKLQQEVTEKVPRGVQRYITERGCSEEVKHKCKRCLLVCPMLKKLFYKSYFFDILYISLFSYQLY